DTANIKISTQTYISRIDSPTAAVTLTFDEEGKIATVATYLDNDYTATGGADETSTIFNASNDTNGSTKVERNMSVLGFDADYMVYVSWNANSNVLASETGLTQDTYSQTGRMIAGIETANEGFPALTGDVIFNGKGKGTYGYYDAADRLTTRNTVFDVVATTDFTARTVGLAVKNTKCVGTCTSFTASSYNFSTALSFASDSNNDVNTTSVNSISKETMFDDNHGLMKGTVDARFYGTGAKEFGGAFAFTSLDDGSTKRYYYGAFGAVRGDIFSNASHDESILTQKTTAIAQNAAATPVDYASLTAASADTANAVAKSFTLNALTVHSNLAENYTRIATDKAWNSGELTQSATLTKVKNSSASFTFAANGNLSAVTAHLSADGTGDYSADTISTPTATALSANIMGAASDETTSINVDRSTIFGFDSAYMAYISWNIAQDENALNGTMLSGNISNIDGMMIAGMETADNGISTTAKNKFTGKGSGIYGNVVDDAIAEYDTSFKVTAIVDYEALNMALTTSETTCTGTGNACDNITVPNALNFSATASFSNGDANNPAATNAISSSAVTAGDLTGTLDARFYGTGTDNANEMGGTFALRNANAHSYYYGVFGTTRDGLAPFAFGVTNAYVFDTVVAANPQMTSVKDQDDSDVVADSLAAISTMADSATDANATISATLQAVAVLNTKNIDYERQTTTGTVWTATEELKIARTITTSQVTSQSAMPAVKLTFDNDGNISGVTVYADADYTATGTASSSTGFTGMMGDTVINVDRSEDFFGFESQNMAYIGWSADTEADLDGVSNTTTEANANTLNGAMIAGVETTSIPTADIVQFRGKGTGVYT
ncbi:MAG: hypothetical protein K0U39_00400, partial [Alphaproteobacteria bacterium]|nr:hypothetical protein [Alphaproteobacteria bacterium]